jgi:prolyl-tRNA editing enzyme YbaK/EbsC (Cys-tRNA(Pro) deacylase)
MSIEKVREYFASFGIEDRVREFEVSSATVELAAIALGCEEARIAKSLSFVLDDGPILVIAAGDVKVDNKKYKQYFGAKAKMPSFDEVERVIGHGVGGVCPFAVNEGVRVYLDESLRRFETVFPACGSASSAIELTIPELERYSSFIAWVDVCKLPEIEK